MSQTIRRWHRRVGVTIALFVILQAGTGLLLEWENASRKPAAHEIVHEHNALGPIAIIHHGYFLATASPAISLYRLLLAVGLVWMAFSGGYIYLQGRRAAGRPRR